MHCPEPIAHTFGLQQQVPKNKSRRVLWLVACCACGGAKSEKGTQLAGNFGALKGQKDKSMKAQTQVVCEQRTILPQNEIAHAIQKLPNVAKHNLVLRLGGCNGAFNKTVHRSPLCCTGATNEPRQVARYTSAHPR